MSEIVTDGSAFIETKCCINFGGHSFCSGGSLLVKRKDTGKLEGLLYAYEKTNEIGSWDGSIKIPALYMYEWRSNFGDKRQTVYFTYQGKLFTGVYYKSGSDIVRVKEIKKDNIRDYYSRRCVEEHFKE